MLIAYNPKLMEQFVIGKALSILGLASCLVMFLAVVGMAVTAFF